MFLIGAIVLAAATAYFFYDFLQQAAKPQTVPQKVVVMARAAIPARQAITADMVATVKFPVNLVFITNSVAELKDVVGKWTITAIKPHELIRQSDITEKNKLPGLAPMIPKGKRAITIGISDNKGVAGAIFPGDRVDIIANVKDPRRNEQVVQVPLQNLEVLAVDRNVTDPTVGAIGSLTLCATPDEAQLITVAEDSGPIRVMLRARDDDKVIIDTGFSPADFLKRSPAPEAPKTTAPAPVQTTAPKPPSNKMTIMIGPNSKEYDMKPSKEGEPKK
ncbi:MAG: Flp pilus assembly protein CpaB [Verrucomicrobia bacterium]|nr:Flp pilus assembly protein CpaB [Verrucomicrobiota bacterium]